MIDQRLMATTGTSFRAEAVRLVVGSGLFLVFLGVIGWNSPSPAELREDQSAESSSAPGRKVSRYVDRLVQKYDRNRDGKLQPPEWSRMQGNPRRADYDADGQITPEELTRRVTEYGRDRRIRPQRQSFWDDAALEPLLHPTTESEAAEAPDARAAAAEEGSPSLDLDSPADGPIDEDARRRRKFYVPHSALPQGLPDWFIRRDANGDAQVTMAEFAPKATRSELERFARYDLDNDGVITTGECLRAAKTAKQPAEP